MSRSASHAHAQENQTSCLVSPTILINSTLSIVDVMELVSRRHCSKCTPASGDSGSDDNVAVDVTAPMRLRETIKEAPQRIILLPERKRKVWYRPDLVLMDIFTENLIVNC